MHQVNHPSTTAQLLTQDKSMAQTKAENLENIISTITSAYAIEQIYLNSYDRDSLPYELIILVSNKYVKTLCDLVPKIMNSIRAYPEYKVMCYVAFQAKDKIREGNLFLYTSCQPHKLVYSKEDSDFVPVPKNFDFARCMELARDLKNREQHKIDEFKAGYYHFKEKGQYTLASFLLHQAMELTYRYLELLVVAKERITHSIRCHHLFMEEISSLYAPIFDEDNPDDILLLERLDDIYRSTRYKNHFEIDPSVLAQLEVKMELLHQNGEQMFTLMRSSFEQHHRENQPLIDQASYPPATIALGKLNDNAYLKAVVEQLKVGIPYPIAIYCFGHRERTFITEGINVREPHRMCDYYFDLLIISETDIREQLSQVQPSIQAHTGVNLFLLAFTKEQVQKQLDKNSPFFHRVLDGKQTLLHAGMDVSGWRWHASMGVRSKQELDLAKISWYQRGDHARGFLHAGHSIDQTEEVVVKVLLYNQAIEQACLGLLSFFFDYTPYQYHFTHLYNMCCSLWYFPNDLFPRSTEEEKRLFKEFADLVKYVRYQGISYIDWDEAYRYEARCEHFLEACNKLFQDSLSEEKR